MAFSGALVHGRFKMALCFILLWMLTVAAVDYQNCTTASPEFNVHGDYYYLFYHGDGNIYRTFNETRAFCRRLGGDMPVITLEEQNRFIADNLRRNTGNYFIGLEDIDDDGTYRWINEAYKHERINPRLSTRYENWADNETLYQPNGENIKSPYCAVMMSANSYYGHSGRGQLNRVACTSKRKHICQIPTGQCRWQELRESQYLIVPGPKKTPRGARRSCQSLGGDLALIKTPKVNIFLKELLPQNDWNDCFLFGLQVDTENGFTWLDNTSVSQKVDDLVPTPIPTKNSWMCLQIRSRWGYRRKSDTSPFICERSVVLPRYNGKPILIDSGYYHTEISWRLWNGTLDTGNGPVVGYKIYLRSGNEVIRVYNITSGDTQDVQPEGMPNWSECFKLKSSTRNCTQNMTDLEAGRTYSVQIAAVRVGIDGELGVGEQGEAFNFTTKILLPSYNGRPEIIESGYSHAEISWRLWNGTLDTGNGPVVGYKIYLRSGTKVIRVYNITSWDTQDVQPERMPDWQECSKSKSSTRNCTQNMTDLEAGRTYSVQIAAVRVGIDGELGVGEEGEALNITTNILPVTSTLSSASPTLTTKTISADDDHDESLDDLTYDMFEHGEPGGQTSSSMATVAGGVVGIIIVILIIIIVIILFKQRRKINQSKTVNEEQETSTDFEDTALDGGCSGQVTISSQNKPTPRSIGTKPAIAAKPCRRKLADDAQEPADDQSGTKPLKRQPIPTAQFPAFVSTNRYTSLFSDEFHDLPEADIYPQTVAQKEINHRKNRYKNILPYDSARVKLKVINEDPNSDYFNASYIPSFENDKAYIASQGPNNASIDDFWRMVWQEKVTTIAMVTKLKEGDKIKCAQYWPNKPGDSKMFGNVKVEFVSQNPCTGGVKREITMKVGKDKRTVTQFHFRVWPDKGVPKHTSLLLKFIKEVKTNHGQNPHPLVIHCSAGVGRTGVVISIDSIAEHAKKTRMVDVFSFVTKIRQNRPFMVQTQEQYAFIYGAVLEDLLWRNTYVPIIHFSDHLKDLRSVDEGGKSKMTKEFETLMTLCPDPPASQTRSGRTPENHHKNRYGNNLPLQRNRVILDSPDNDYINASCIRGVHCTFITTQMPMPSTVSDFCCMVLTRQPSTIVMLNDKDQDDKSCAQYWSDDGIAELGSYKVSILSTSENDDMTIRQLKITKNSKSCHTVTQYQFLGWQKHGSTEKSRALSFLKLVSAVKSALKNKSEFSVLVHCLSGVGRTGAFCSILECIAHMEDSDSVDIFQTVKILRADRMQFVQTEDDYAFIYDVIRAYLHEKNYEQLPYPVEDHTYGNLDTDDYCTPDPEENPYEVTDSQAAGASGLVYGNVETGKAKQSQRPTPTNSQTLYENFEFES